MPTFKNDPVESQTDSTTAVHGTSDVAGVVGESSTWHGVAGITQSTIGGSGVYGAGQTGGTGVTGTSQTWVGVFGETFGAENGPAGVWADGHEGGSGVKGHTSCPGANGVAGYHLTNQGPGIYGQGAPAGLFEGDVQVTGNLTVKGSDLVERLTQVEQQSASAAQLGAKITTLQSQVNGVAGQLAALQSQVNTAVSNLTGRVTQVEVAINELNARVTALGG